MYGVKQQHIIHSTDEKKKTISNISKKFMKMSGIHTEAEH
jgi:hypothetical protein